MNMLRTIVMCSFLVVGAAAAQDLNITGAGARAEGFGGAFIGVADDATAIVWNPAGLTQLERAEASVVSRIIAESWDFSNGINSSYNNTYNQSHGVFNFGSVALPIHMGSTRLVLALAYQRQLDFYGEYIVPNFEKHNEGGVDTFTPGFGINLGPVISVGASANIWTGKFTSSAEDKSGIGSTEKQDFTYKGFNIVAGVMADFEGMSSRIPVKVGVSLRTPFSMTSDGTFEERTGSSSYIGKYDVSQTIKMPFMIGFGISGRLFENLTLAADYEIRSYADKEIEQKVDGFGSETYKISKDNLNEFRIGAEYLIVGKKVVIPVRIGFRTVPTVNRNVDNFGVETDQVVGSAVSIGTGCIFKHFALDGAFTYASSTWNEASTALKNSTGTVSLSLIVYM